MNEIKLNIPSSTKQLPIAVFCVALLCFVFVNECGVNGGKLRSKINGEGLNFLMECSVVLPKVVVEDSSNTSCLFAVRDVEVIVCSRFEFGVGCYFWVTLANVF